MTTVMPSRLDLADQLDADLQFRRIQAGQPFVEQQQFRACRQRTSELDALLVDIGQLPAEKVRAIRRVPPARAARRYLASPSPGAAGSLPNILPIMTFSRVVMPGRTRTSWNVRAMRMRQISNERAPMISSPWKWIDPESGGSSPVMRLRTVVLPEPFGPIRPVMPPDGTSKERSRTATRPPNALLKTLYAEHRAGAQAAAVAQDGLWGRPGDAL